MTFQSVLTLSEREIKQIRIVQPVFQRVQDLTGVPWQAVAAVWYRESFSTTSPKTPGGPFQFDPPPSPETLRKLLQRFTSLNPKTIETYVHKGIHEFEAGALFAACWLRLKAKGVITPDVSDAVIQDAFYGYNGRAYGAADKSPYVMNGYSPAHRNMILRGSIPDGKGGRRQITTVDKRPGAFTVYKQLKSLAQS